MKLSVLSIGLTVEQDDVVYELMEEYGYSGLEIAPTRIFPENPCEKLKEAEAWSESLKADPRFVISSLQSILFGRQEKIFSSNDERRRHFCKQAAVPCRHSSR